MTSGGGRSGTPARSPRRDSSAGRARPDDSTGRVRTSSGNECRCFCGSLLARRTPEGVELKCRRCKRTLLVPIPAEGSTDGEEVENSGETGAPPAGRSTVSAGARGQ
jgi:phage FluMu protein Com